VKVWLDANLDPAIAPFLGSQFNVFVSHVRELGLQQSTDLQLFEAARRLQVTMIVSKDSDFVDLVTLKGPPPKIIWLTCGNLPTASMQRLLSQTFGEAMALLESGSSWVEIGSKL
jgi:predicted nuclease of predicted toxin-antitoxin system